MDKKTSELSASAKKGVQASSLNRDWSIVKKNVDAVFFG
jgi:hypothetical protein